MVIYKYTLASLPKQTIIMPEGSRLISAKEQSGRMVVYAMVSPEEIGRAAYTVYIVGTGQEIPTEATRFLGTVKLQGGLFMFHIFTEGK